VCDCGFACEETLTWSVTLIRTLTANARSEKNKMKSANETWRTSKKSDFANGNGF